MFYTVYRTTNNLNGKVYVGKHETTDLDDGYLGSGVLLVKAIEKYGRENFSKEVMFVFDNEHEMNLKEMEIVTEDFAKRDDTYNLGVGGEGGPQFKGKQHSQETREKLRRKGRLQVVSEEVRTKISEANRRRFSDPKVRAAMAEKKRGTRQSEETRRKISQAMKGNSNAKKRIMSEWSSRVSSPAS